MKCGLKFEQLLQWLRMLPPCFLFFLPPCVSLIITLSVVSPCSSYMRPPLLNSLSFLLFQVTAIRFLLVSHLMSLNNSFTLSHFYMFLFFSRSSVHSLQPASDFDLGHFWYGLSVCKQDYAKYIFNNNKISQKKKRINNR